MDGPPRNEGSPAEPDISICIIMRGSPSNSSNA
jgi:hypothetical protein